MADLKAQLEISADASGVEVGVNKAKRSLASLGVTAATAGKDAAAGLDKIGDSGEKSAGKVGRATQNMISSIQRTTATLDAGSRSSSKYFEVLAGQRGVDVSALKPYLDQLDAVKTRQQAATTAAAAIAPAFTQTGMSAKAMSAALRGVPAQFTDIAVSLQGGQAPLTVFLQQGGQLKDMFGGAIPAARALGGYVLGLVNPFTIAAAAVASLGLAYFQGSKEADAFAKAIILSGNASGTSIGQLTQMADRISAVTGTQSAAAAALAQFAESGRVASDSIERVTLIALKMEKEAGQAISATVKEFAELGKAPVEASIKLNESTNYLTKSIFQQIRALDDQGRAADAAALAQKAYADALDVRLTQVNTRLGFIERGWRSVTGAAKEAWDAMLNVGRADTLQQQLSKAQEDLAARQNRGPLNETTSASFEKGNAALRDRIAFLSESVRVETRSGEAAKNAAEQTRAYVEFSKEGDKYLSNRAKSEKEIAAARELGNKAGLSSVEIEKRVADIRANYADKGAAGTARQISKADLGLDLENIRNDAQKLLATYANTERVMEAQRSAGLIGDAEYYAQKRKFIQDETRVKDEGLQKEIARFQQEKLAGKDKIDNERKIADATGKLAILRADASSKMEVLSVQEAAANSKLTLSYLSARQAAQDYFDTQNRQQSRDLSSIGQGTQKRNFNAGISQIEDRYAGQRRDLENQRAQQELEGKFTSEARQQYDQRLAIINEFQARSIGSYIAYYDQLTGLQKDWGLGAQEGLANYLNDATNVFAQTQDLVSGAFKGMEDALVSFAKTGKLDFRSLADSIISDLIRIQVRSQVTGPLSGLLKTGISSLFGGGLGSSGVTIGGLDGMNSYAGGGYTGGASRSGGLDGQGGFMAMMHPQETVTDHARGGSGEMSLTIVNNTSAPIGRVTQQQISPTERALIIEEAVQAGAAQFNDPNSRTSKTLSANYRMQRNR